MSFRMSDLRWGSNTFQLGGRTHGAGQQLKWTVEKEAFALAWMGDGGHCCGLDSVVVFICTHPGVETVLFLSHSITVTG